MPGVTPPTSTEPTDTTSPRPRAETGEPRPPGALENIRSGMRGERPCASAPPWPTGLAAPPRGREVQRRPAEVGRRPVLSTLRGAGDDFVHNGRTHDDMSSSTAAATAV